MLIFDFDWTYLSYINAPDNSSIFDFQEVFDYLKKHGVKYFGARELSPKGTHHLQFISTVTLEQIPDLCEELIRIRKKYTSRKGINYVCHRRINVDQTHAFNYNCKGTGPSTPST